MSMQRKVIYKITYPNGKIYIGQDVTDDINYYGSPNKRQLEEDFPIETRKSFTITKDILWEIIEQLGNSDIINKKEMEFIALYESNNPLNGYNLRPKYKKISYGV
jgi:hypothetical protein